MKFKELTRKIFSTKKGKAIFSIVIAAAILGVSVGSYKGYQANEKAKQEALIEKENEERTENYKSLAKECDDEIDAIGTVTAESEPLVKRAEDYYDGLPKGAKEYVTKYDDLVKARTSLDALLTSKDKADKVIAEIDGIGDVELTKADQIATARTDYDALSDDEKAMVTNYDTLTSAEETLTALNEKATSKDTEVPSQTALNKKSKKATTKTKTNTSTNTATTTTTTPAPVQTTTDTAAATTPSTTTTPADTASTTTPSTETTTTQTTDTASTNASTSSEPTITSIVDDNLPGSRGTTKLVTYSDGSYGVQLNNGTIVGSDW